MEQERHKLVSAGSKLQYPSGPPPFSFSQLVSVKKKTQFFFFPPFCALLSGLCWVFSLSLFWYGVMSVGNRPSSTRGEKKAEPEEMDR